MAQKTYSTSLGPRADLITDYALLAIGIGSALIALIFLIVA